MVNVIIPYIPHIYGNVMWSFLWFATTNDSFNAGCEIEYWANSTLHFDLSFAHTVFDQPCDEQNTFTNGERYSTAYLALTALTMFVKGRLGCY